MIQLLRGEQHHSVISVEHLTPNAFVLRISREELVFIPGQHITLGIPGLGEMREYSVYNAPTDHYLEVLVKTVENGAFTPRLAQLRMGDTVTVDGPNGYFTLKKETTHRHHLFIATGTGISPFHSFVRSFPDLKYTLVHGIRNASECYDRDDYPSGKYICCTSRSSDGDFEGRVTDFLQNYSIPDDSEIMLCGNSQMILDVWELLSERHTPMERMRQEIYF